MLDSAEVTRTQHVCNGGSGLNALVLISNEPAGVNCANGGKKVDAGQDINRNGMLDPAEITTAAYVCNGINGSNGTNGLNSLMSIVPEPVGAFCTYGGNKVSSGLDSNANGILDPAEITASNYVCNGAPGATGPAGAGVTWVNVTASAVQAASNTGYMANNAAQVTITLPTAPAVGDVVQVSGIGSGGWRVAQNAGQSIIINTVQPIIFKGTAGALWAARETARNWHAVASSADGSKLVAVVPYRGQIWTSTDSGATWSAHESARDWRSVASSADGSKLVAAVWHGQLYISTDGGATWNARETAKSWRSVASSADGSKLVAVEAAGQIWTSSDSGATWSAHESASLWQSVASSADGSKLVTVVEGGQIWTSTDSGATWNAHESAKQWWSVASSADGSKLVAVVQGGQIWTSTDFGATWSAHESTRWWLSVASSADGSKLVAVEVGGQIWISTDSGATWNAHESAREWRSVASSADGSKLVAAVWNGQLYTSIPSSTVGIAGSISGAQYESVDLQCVDANTFMVRGFVGDLMVQ
jgi:photosystem II stability/assembly factor-like uncharacterized protein